MDNKSIFFAMIMLNTILADFTKPESKQRRNIKNKINADKLD